MLIINVTHVLIKNNQNLFYILILRSYQVAQNDHSYLRVKGGQVAIL